MLTVGREEDTNDGRDDDYDFDEDSD